MVKDRGVRGRGFGPIRQTSRCRLGISLQFRWVTPINYGSAWTIGHGRESRGFGLQQAPYSGLKRAAAITYSQSTRKPRQAVLKGFCRHSHAAGEDCL
jgi:hypothetical protein